MQLDDRYTERGSISFIITKIQVETTVKYNFLFTVLAKIENMGNSKCWQRCGEMGTIKLSWWVELSYSEEQLDSF